MTEVHEDNRPQGANEHAGLDLAGDEAKYGADLKRQNPAMWWATLLGPLGVTGAMLVLAGAFRGVNFMINLAVSATMVFFGLGRAVLLLGRDGAQTVADMPKWQQFLASMTTQELLVLILWMDALTAFIMIFHASFIYRIPKIGPGMLALQEDGEFFLSQHPWMRRFAWLGLVAFVTFPFAATGSVGGSILGRLLGLSRWATLSGVIMGSVISSLTVYAFAATIKKSPYFKSDSPWTLIGSIVLIVVIFAFINWRIKKMKQRWAKEQGK
ncbi:MAG: small multi-drug export protein [Planctomycetota bacterium]|nr:small multi-drug export protein [Planctomycetota bacterium]